MSEDGLIRITPDADHPEIYTEWVILPGQARDAYLRLHRDFQGLGVESQPSLQEFWDFVQKLAAEHRKAEAAAKRRKKGGP